jgi:hypothetical protein
MMNNPQPGDICLSPKNRTVIYRIVKQDHPEDGRMTIEVVALVAGGEIRTQFTTGDRFEGIDVSNFIKLGGCPNED